jgi:hypothetical protein
MEELERLTCGQKIPAELLDLIKRIQELYDDKLRIVSVEGHWITVEARRLTDTHLLKQMMDDEKKIFLKDQLNRFQILCPWDYRTGRGIKIRYLGLGTNGAMPGFWWI